MGPPWAEGSVLHTRLPAAGSVAYPGSGPLGGTLGGLCSRHGEPEPGSRISATERSPTGLLQLFQKHCWVPSDGKCPLPMGKQGLAVCVQRMPKADL